MDLENTKRGEHDTSLGRKRKVIRRGARGEL
jgi:hypothetical protein